MGLMLLALPASAQTVSSLDFLTGNWEGQGFEESWGPGKAGTMLGTSRATESGKTVHTEFMLLKDEGDSCTLTLYLPEKGKTIVMKPALQHNSEVQFVREGERLTYKREGDVLRIKLEKPTGGFELTLQRR